MTTFTLSYSERKYYRPALVETYDGRVLDCATDPEGLIYLFALADIANILATYSYDTNGWYFNATRDRYIAEPYHFDMSKVMVNPQFVTKNFATIVV